MGRRVSSPKLVRTWQRWRRTTRRWASRPRRARARKKAMATSSEQAATEQLQKGGAHRCRETLLASCKQVVHKQRVSTLSLKDLRVSTQKIGVFSPRRLSAFHLHDTPRPEMAESLDRLVSLPP